MQSDTYPQAFNTLLSMHCISCLPLTGVTHRVRISARVRESTLTKSLANESTRVQLDSHKLSDVSHKLNTGESKDSCKLHPEESKWDSRSSLRNSTPDTFVKITYIDEVTSSMFINKGEGLVF